MGGRLISFSPARGPLLSSRRSLQILDILTEIRLSTLENMTKAPMSEVASIRFSAWTSSNLEIRESSSMARLEYSGLAVMPVPMAVAPRLISRNSWTTTLIRWMSSLTVTRKPSNSWPRVMGTASWSWVRPILITSENSTDFCFSS